MWIEPEQVYQLFFDLGYRAHGGSGLGYSWDTVAAMPVPAILEMVRLLESSRNAEAEQIRQAQAQAARRK